MLVSGRHPHFFFSYYKITAMPLFKAAPINILILTMEKWLCRVKGAAWSDNYHWNPPSSEHFCIIRHIVSILNPAALLIALIASFLTVLKEKGTGFSGFSIGSLEGSHMDVKLYLYCITQSLMQQNVCSWAPPLNTYTKYLQAGFEAQRELLHHFSHYNVMLKTHAKNT